MNDTDATLEALTDAIWDVTGGSREAVAECIDTLGWTSESDADSYEVTQVDVRLGTYNVSEA